MKLSLRSKSCFIYNTYLGVNEQYEAVDDEICDGEDDDDELDIAISEFQTDSIAQSDSVMRDAEGIVQIRYFLML